ncbi:MAG: hypothetical protein NVSMB51_18320 [Solirubrobacteraceae bacterium]
MPDKLMLLVCSVDQGGFKQHPCRQAHEALEAAGHDHEKVVHDKAHPFGLRTTGRRPELKRLSGQEKLPVLLLPGGEAICGGKQIVAWARQNPPA